MAKYEREFLVPYLMNLCALQLAHRKLSERESDLSFEARRLEDGVRNANEPKAPWIEPTPPGGIFLAVMSVITLLMSFLMSSLDLNFLSAFFVFGAVVEAIPACILIKSAKSDNETRQATYQCQMAEYNKAVRLNEADRQKKLPPILNDLKKCQKEKKNVEVTLQRAYGVNVIPMQYRNLYASVFLYDWFSSSRADDLEMALNMFVLEEIKEKLDRIIANQSAMILNQQMMLANQQKTLEQQNQHAEMMRMKLDQIQASNEDRNMYLSMIESNTATTAYFATAEYIRHI